MSVIGRGESGGLRRPNRVLRGTKHRVEEEVVVAAAGSEREDHEVVRRRGIGSLRVHLPSTERHQFIITFNSANSAVPATLPLTLAFNITSHCVWILCSHFYTLPAPSPRSSPAPPPISILPVCYILTHLLTLRYTYTISQ